MVSFRLSPELRARIARVAKATRLKKTTIIEMCVEMELPRIEERFAEDLAEYDRVHPEEVASLIKRGYFAQKPSSTQIGVAPGMKVKPRAEKFSSGSETPRRK